MKRAAPWKMAVTLVLAFIVGVYLVASRVLDHFLANGALARLIGKKTAVILEADSGYLPLQWHGLTVRSDGILVRGEPARSLTQMSAVNLRAYCSLQNLWQRKWTITRLQASHLQAAFGRAAAANLQQILPNQPPLEPQIETSSPLKLDIRETVVPRTDIWWGDTAEAVGYIKDVEARFYPQGHGLDAFGRGGTFRQTGWPELKIEELRLHYSKPKLTIASAVLSIGQPRNFAVTGGFDFGAGGAMRLHVHSAQTPADPFVMGFWHGKLEGTFNTETDLHKAFGAQAKVDAAGEIRFDRALVHDVESLQKVALLTRHPQFEKPKVDVLVLHYRWTGSRLEVTAFEAESKGLMRIEGEFALENRNIDGHFKIGVAADVAEAIPGAREKVFTEPRGGYLWTSLTLSGPASHPREDLKKRLVAAAQEHFAKGFLSSIFKPGKEVIEGLNGLYH